MTRANRLRLRAYALREVAGVALSRAKSCRVIRTDYWRSQAWSALANARRLLDAAEALDTEADRLVVGAFPFPFNLIGAS